MLRYPGTKRRHLERFIRPFFRSFYSTHPRSIEFREPFVGSGAVVLDLLTHGIIERVWINDADPGLVALWNTVIEHPQRLIKIIKKYRPTVDDFERFKTLSMLHETVESIDDMVTAALAKLVTHQASYSGLGAMGGVLGGAQVKENGEPKAYVVDSRWNPDRIIKNIETAHALLSKANIRTGRCTNLDFSDVLSERGDFIAFCDPPYYQMGEDLYWWYMKGKDHRELARCLKALDHPFLLTIDDCDDVRKMYKWASMTPISVGSSINAQGRQRELLVCAKDHVSLMEKITLDLTPIPVPESPQPSIPADVYRNLPPILKEATNQFAAGTEKDIFLTGALPVIAGVLAGVQGDHGDGPVGLNLYTVILGAAGTGKGVLRFARRLGEVIDERMISEQDEDRERTFFLPANASVRALVDALAANDGHGVIHEAELQTLVNSLKQGWGNFKDLLLKSFHQEAVTLTRKAHTIRILDPTVSMVLSGTPESVRKLVQSQTDGLFSRVAFYSYDSTDPWRTQRPNTKTTKRETVISEAARRLDELHQVLDGRSKPLVVRLDDRHWDLIDGTFEIELDRLRDQGAHPALEATVKRAGVIGFRIACSLTVIRAFDQNARLGNVRDIIATDVDVLVGVCLAQVYLRHAVTLSDTMPEVEDAKAARGNRELIYSLLPDVPFTTGEAIALCRHLGISERTVKKSLARLTDEGRLKRLRHGQYMKIEAKVNGHSKAVNGAKGSK